MAYRLRENEEDAQSRLALDFDIILTPSGKIEDTITAFEDINNYGIYKSNLRKEQAIEDYYGPTIPTTKNFLQNTFKLLQKEYDNENELKDAFIKTVSEKNKNIKNLEQKYYTLKNNNGNFYPKTSKAEMDKFIEQNKSKRKLVNFVPKGNTLVFPKGSNPEKDLTKKIIKTVMDSAGIDFTIKEKESVSEDSVTDKIRKSLQFQATGGKKGEPMSKGQDLPANTKIKKSELKEMIKEEIKEVLNSSNWTISNIQSWISEYFSNKNMDLELVDKIEKMDSAYGSKTMFYIYEVGEDHGLIIKSSQVADAPRLNELDVIVGTKGDSRGKLTNTLKITNSTGNKAMLYDMFDKKFK